MSWTLMGIAEAASELHVLAVVGAFTAAIGHLGVAVWELRRRRRVPAPSPS